ncbi:response regulator transcription factor [Allopusillimonas ginsengisoli]|uniref:response regulator transcription factor n=1 Tax=Allopusillimonas ginsengisoli TaxID=453575 RepID=UPI00101FFC79|nr:response regulator transcription factor [Allopusillimonas ginsengisoli]TEA80053.1 response regulator transcription factor [Allopusillimonas ginsengisoli]
MTELLIADDHPLFREALRGVVSRIFPDTVIHEADQFERLYALVEAYPDADMLLLDLDMPGASGFSGLVHLRSLHPQLPIVIVSAHEEPSIMRRALDHGAMGFIPKSSDSRQLGQALQQILEGFPWAPAGVENGAGADEDEMAAANRLRDLTPQQFRVLQMVYSGQLNKQIAYELNVSEATIKAHMTHIMRKLGASNRTQAVLIASRLGIPEDPALRG